MNMWTYWASILQTSLRPYLNPASGFSITQGLTENCGTYEVRLALQSECLGNVPAITSPQPSSHKGPHSRLRQPGR